LERDAFDKLMVDQLPGLLRFAIRLTGNAGDGEDLAHETLVKAMKASASLRDVRSMRSWLFRIAIYAHQDWVRSERSVDWPKGVEPISLDPLPADRSAGRELGALIASAVSTLPGRQREVLILSAYEGLDSAEVAEALGISEQNVRTTLHLAREKLRAQLNRFLDVEKPA